MIELGIAVVMGCGVMGLALIIAGYNQPEPVVVHVHPTPAPGRTLLDGKIDRTGRLAVINGLKIVLPEVEKPGVSCRLVVAI